MAVAPRDHALDRLVFFSDAVFAIAITLLIIEIHVPALPRGANDAAHWRALAHLAPNFSGFIISFAVVGAFWIGHHRYMSLAAHFDPRILGWNLGLLAMIAFMPFATAYLSAYMNERVPSLIYCASLFVASLFNIKVNHTATSPPMVDEAVTPDRIFYVRRRSLGLMLGAATALGLASIVPQFAQIGLISIPIWRRVLMAIQARRDRVAA